jgi:hypothetical protein
MTDGYELPYIARTERPYWRYEFGQSPLEAAPAGNIPEGSKLCLQRQPTKLDACRVPSWRASDGSSFALRTSKQVKRGQGHC